MAGHPELVEVERYCRSLWLPGEVREDPDPNARRSGGTASGYFDDPGLIVAEIAPFDGRSDVFITINPVERALHSRAFNRIRERARETTTDAHVLRRRWLPVDIDAVRPTGISATDDEVKQATAFAREVVAYLVEQGFGMPLTSMSGNGVQLLYPVDLPNDEASTQLVKGFLERLATRFDSGAVKVDTSVHNPSRIMALIGTMKTKGDSTPDRPHRRSAILHAPDAHEPVPLERLAALVPTTRGSTTITVSEAGLPRGWVRSWLDDAGLVYREQQPDGRGTVYYHLESCPWHPDDGAFECGPGEMHDGKGAFHGFHDRCTGKTWHDLRAALRLGPEQGPGAGRRDRDGDGQRPGSGQRALRLTPASAIAPRPVHWAWQDRLPRGSLCLLGGREGIGKSIVEADLIARVTRGTLPGCWAGTPRNVIVVAAEDSWSHTIVPRLMAAGADLDRVFRVDVVTSDGLGVEISLPQDIGALEAAIIEHAVALVCLDPLISRIDGALDTHKDAEVRQALEPLAKLADRTEALVLGLIHVNKGQGDPLTILMASRAFAAVPRAVLFMLRDPDDERTRLLGQPKNNLGRDDLPMLRFHIEGAVVAVTDEGPVGAGRAVWDGESDGSLHDAVVAAQEGVNRTAVEEAADWLEDYLAVGAVWKKKVVEDAKAAGHNLAAINRAASRLKVKSEGRGFPRTSWWSLPVISTHDSAPVVSSAGESAMTEMTATTVRDGGSKTAMTGTQSSQSSQSSHTPRESELTGAPELSGGGLDGSPWVVQQAFRIFGDMLTEAQA